MPLERRAPAEQAAHWLGHAERAASEGNGPGALYHLGRACDAWRYDRKASGLAAWMREHPQAQAAYVPFLRTVSDPATAAGTRYAFQASNVSELISAIESYEALARCVPDAAGGSEAAALRESVFARIAAGEIEIGYNEAPKRIAALDDDRALLALIGRGLAAGGQAKPRQAALAADIIKRIGTDDPATAAFGATVLAGKLNPADLRTLVAAGVQPLRDAMTERLRKLRVSVTPRDVLFEEDLRERLAKSDLPYAVLGRDQADVAADVTLEIERLRHEERVTTSPTSTVSYAPHQINIGQLLMMPQNASYLFDETAGAIELDCGYELRAAGKALPRPASQLVRDTVRQRWVMCRNARIRNAFGGERPADFVANNDMASRCAQAVNEPPSATEARAQVLDKIVSTASQMLAK